MKKAIVLGASGFVGSAVVRELINKGVEVTVILRPRSGNCELPSRLNGLPVQVVYCNLSDISTLPDLTNDRDFDAFYQFAWNGLAGEDLLDYHLQIMNISWMMDAIVAAAALRCKRFIGAGSISQFELDTLEGQIHQDDKHKVYKTAKLACEYMGRSVSAKNGIEFLWPIITNIYGPGEKSPRLINSMIRNLLSSNHQSLSEGNQLYDFIYITDAARAFQLIGEKGQENRTYVIASGNAQPLKNYLCQLRDIVSPGATLGFGEFSFNGIDLPEKYYDITSLQQDTGFVPLTDFSAGIQQTMQWIKEDIQRSQR